MANFFSTPREFITPSTSAPTLASSASSRSLRRSGRYILLDCSGDTTRLRDCEEQRGSPLPPQVRARRTFHDRRPVQSRAVAVQEIFGMADRRDWGGGGDDPEESTQHMIERIWESLTDIRARMDQQAPVPPVAVPSGDGETVHVAPVPPRVEVPFAAPVPPPPVLLAEEPVMQVEKFLRLQPPTYSGGPNPDTAEHWVHEIERVFATMRCPTADKVVLAAYQLRGFALEWW
ncbi:hypothetical protein Taro_012491 [Colocasia esculenta]|uniref:Uncharacterized protein n=1 Tax=Colocasia esculenta TaxID=4460 RepID=A0A843UD03_COLES|nr:hypothetical protein [Colocasia esculenta]